MRKKLASILMIAALAVTLSGTSVLASNVANLDEKTDPAVPSERPAKAQVKPNQQLQNNVRKLLADARAGKIAPASKSQLQPATSNHWSKQTKIVVGVGIAVAVVVVILVVKHEKDHLFDDFRPFQQVRNP